MPENIIFYLNNASLSYKDDKMIYYCALLFIGQIVPMLNQPEDITTYELQPNEVKMIRPKYDVALYYR